MGLLTTPDLLTMINVAAAPGTQVYLRFDMLRINTEAAVRRWAKWAYGIEAQYNWTEFYDGNGYVDQVLKQPYSASVANVWLDAQGAYGQSVNAFSGTPLIQGSDYAPVLDTVGGFRSGLLRRLNNTIGWFPSDRLFYSNSGGLGFSKGAYWPRGSGNLKVQYSWGFQPVTQLSSVSWSGGVATVNSSSNLVLWPGEWVTLTGFDVGSAYNGDFMVQSVPSATSFTLAINSDPGAPVAIGTVDAIPRDIKLAIATAVSIVQNKVRLGYPLTSESLGDYNYSLQFTKDVDFGDVRQLLSPYRDLSLGGGPF